MTLALLVALLAVPTHAAATALPTLGIVDVGGAAHVDDQGAAGGNGVWIWLESNGAAGLQRGGCSAVVPDDCYPCGGYGDREACDPHPDTLVL